MNRRTPLQTLLASLAVPLLQPPPWPKKSTPLRVNRQGDAFTSTVMLFDEDKKEVGFFEVRYNQKTKELLFFLQSEKDSEVSCIVDGWKPNKFKHDGMYRIKMTH